MQEELERGETFTVPEVNILHETAEPARTFSTYVQKRMVGEPVAGPVSNIPSQHVNTHGIKSNNNQHDSFLSQEENDLLFGLESSGNNFSGLTTKPEGKSNLPTADDSTTNTTADTTPNLYGASSTSLEKETPVVVPTENKTYSSSVYQPSLQGSTASNNYSTGSKDHGYNPLSFQGSSSNATATGRGNIVTSNAHEPHYTNRNNQDDSLFQDSLFSEANSVNK